MSKYEMRNLGYYLSFMRFITAPLLLRHSGEVFTGLLPLAAAAPMLLRHCGEGCLATRALSRSAESTVPNITYFPLYKNQKMMSKYEMKNLGYYLSFMKFITVPQHKKDFNNLLLCLVPEAMDPH
jgi:hypothetical protein